MPEPIAGAWAARPDASRSAASRDVPAGSIWEVFERAAELWPERDAIVCGADRATFAAIRSSAAALADHMRRRGIGAGDGVAVWSTNSVDWSVWYAATAARGATLVPLHAQATPNEIATALERAGVRALAAGSDQRQLIASDAGRPIRDALELLGVAMSAIEDRPASRPSIDGFQSDPLPDRPAILKFTSGSSGTPKGVCLAGPAAVRNAHNAALRLGLTAGDRLYSGMPFFHAGGSILTVLSAALMGATVISAPRYRAADALQLMESYAVTARVGMDVMYLKEMLEPAFDPRRTATLRTGWIAGAPDMAQRVLDRWGCPFVNLYGMTELSGNTCMTSLEDEDEVRVRWAGQPQPGVEVGIFEPGGDDLLGRGHLGEIRVRGWSVMMGYLAPDGAIDPALDTDGWFRTGDFGEMVGGYLRFAGRMKDMLKVGGENVDCAEVEAVLLDHPSVALVAVIGIADDVFGELPVAFVQVDGKVDTSSILDHCRARLASFKVPREVHYVDADAWPRTGPEKISKAALRTTAMEARGGR